MAFKEDQFDVSTTSPNEKNLKLEQELQDALAEIDAELVEPGWDSEEVEDESWSGKRGSNSNPTHGVRGAGPKTVKK